MSFDEKICDVTDALFKAREAVKDVRKVLKAINNESDDSVGKLFMVIKMDLDLIEMQSKLDDWADHCIEWNNGGSAWWDEQAMEVLRRDRSEL